MGMLVEMMLLQMHSQMQPHNSYISNTSSIIDFSRTQNTQKSPYGKHLYISQMSQNSESMEVIAVKICDDEGEVPSQMIEPQILNSQNILSAISESDNED